MLKKVKNFIRTPADCVEGTYLSDNELDEGLKLLLHKRRIIYSLLITAILIAVTATQLDASTSTTGQSNAPQTINLTTSPPETTWNRTYGGAGSDDAYAFQQTSDGGYIVAGSTNSSGAGGRDFWLVRTGASGNHLWNKTYGGADDDEAYAVQQTGDGGYVMAGFTDSSGAGGYDFWLVKTDSEGNHLWNKTYGGAGDEFGCSVQETSDGGYIIAGYTSTSNNLNNRFWIVKTDGNGYQQWNRTYAGIGGSRAFSVEETSDGGYIVAGYTDVPIADNGYWLVGVNDDFWLVKIDSAGNHQWNKTYGVTCYDAPFNVSRERAYSVQETSDGGYIIAGETYYWKLQIVGNDIKVSQVRDFWVVKTNGSGDHLWNKTYGGTGLDAAYSIQEMSEGGYIVGGSTSSYGAGGYDFWLVRIDADGNHLWNRTYGGANDDCAYCVKETSDGFVVAGWTRSFGEGRSDFWLVKIGDVMAPSTVADLATGSATSDSVTLTWTAPGDDGMKGNATGYVVKYSTISHITADNWSLATTYPQSWKPAENGTAETHVVTGLVSGTEYWFAVEAYDDVDKFGWVSNSPSAITTTATSPLDTTAPAAITDLAADTTTNTSITLTWTAPGDDGYTGNPTGYIVKYSTTGSIDSGNWDSASTYTQSWTPTKNGTEETHVVTDLTPGTKYWFAIEAYDDASPPNYGAVSNSPNTTTAATTTEGSSGSLIILVVGIALAAVVVTVATVANSLTSKKRRPTRRA
jgi:TolB-like protein